MIRVHLTLICSAILLIFTGVPHPEADACLPPEPAINDVISTDGEELPVNGVLRLAIPAGTRRVNLRQSLTIERGAQGGERLTYERIEPGFNFHPLIRITSIGCSAWNITHSSGCFGFSFTWTRPIIFALP